MSHGSIIGHAPIWVHVLCFALAAAGVLLFEMRNRGVHG